MRTKIPSNRPFISGGELSYVAQALRAGEIASDGHFTRECARLLEERFGICKVLMTPSCSAALEMAARLCGIKPGSEVIMPSFTFASTANAVVMLGARPVFVDLRPDTLNLDERLIERAITPRTRAIFPIHYAGVGCEMNRIMEITREYKLMVVEDAAQGVNAFYGRRALGSIGQLGAYSFHSTKNYTCGEGGALLVNDPELIERAEIIRDKGTNRGKFLRGEVDKYTWVDVGSSYVPSEIVCAFLYAQLEMMDALAARRREVFQFYHHHLRPLEERGFLRLPFTPQNCESNYHIYYVLLPDGTVRDSLTSALNQDGIAAASHYVPLHSAPMGQTFGYREGDLPVTEEISERLLRLPIYPSIMEEEQLYIVNRLSQFLEREKVCALTTEIEPAGALA